MNKIINIIALILMAGSMLFTSCTEDEMYRPNLSTGDGSLTLQLSVPDPIVVQPETRAGVEDFNTITDLNVVIASGSDENSTIEKVFYYTYGQSYNNASEGINYNGANAIHFSKEYVGQNSLTSKSIFVVANWGSEISVNNVGALKSLKQETNSLPGNPVGCMMFAEAKDGGNGSHITGDNGAILTAELERTVAMITVQINGENLSQDVILQPRSVSLHRVPKSCYIGKANNVSTSDIVEEGSIVGGRGDLNWPEIPYDRQAGEGTVGEHYNDNYDSDPQIACLFMFENYHGENFGAQDASEKDKRPAGCESTEPNDIFNDNSTKTCSYLDVEAYYVKMNAARTASVYSGTVHFRLFLGGDVTEDFNVMRNTYYKVTLTLTGNAVTEGGQIDENGNLIPDKDSYKWRVETDLATFSFATGDILVNASGEYIPIKVDASKDYYYTIEGTSDNIFLWFYYPSIMYGTEYYNWYAVSTTAMAATVTDGNIWLYAAPWSPTYGQFDGKSRKQSVTLTAYNSENDRDNGQNPVEKRTLEVVQYTPIIYEAESDYIQEVFGTRQITMLIDRVDREAMPWGFKGDVLDFNGDDGFHNTYHLIDPSPSGCSGHRDIAKNYLPWGKMNGGSAMVYATTFWKAPDTPPNTDINDMITNPTFPDYTYNPDQDQYYDSYYYWTLPSIAGWQVIEQAAREGKLDEEFPIIEYLPYWTSDAVTSQMDGTGTTSSYSYQFGKGLDKLTKDEPYPSDQIHERDEKLRFRLVAIKKGQMSFD